MPKRSAQASKGKSKAHEAQKESLPEEKIQWPQLKPLIPKSDLFFDVVLEDQIVIIRKFFTTALSRQYVKFLSSLPLTTTPGIPKKGEAMRVNDRFQIEDAAFAEQLWSTTGLKDVLPSQETNWGGETLGLNPRIRIYRYKKGQFFDQHYDESNLLEFPSEPPVKAKTTWTLLIYLTGSTTGCEGGETIFYPEYGQVKDFFSASKASVEPISVAPEEGMALFHKHGDDCLLHEGSEVTSGEKWIIRSDLCVVR